MALFLILSSKLFIGLCLPADNEAVSLLTVAEQSNFRATARYEEVTALLDRLARESPLVQQATLETTTEGRAIPLIILSNPPVSTPEEARRQVVELDKLMVLAIGNIHAGEVDGKEALPMIAREIITSPDHPLLKNLIIAFAPIYNADGNERVSKDNRPGQLGPEEGMGVRENGSGLDLNRDFIKLEAPETRGLVSFLNQWDPAIFIDTHTTNGCFHRYLITYEGPKVPAGDFGVISFVREAMLPQIRHELDGKFAVPSFPYGDFNRDHTRWETFPAQARYGTSYVGLRNRISILSEGYSYAPYRERVLATRDFVKACLEYAATHKAEIKKCLDVADARTKQKGREPSPDDRVTLRTRPARAPGKVTAAGVVEEERGGRQVSTGVSRDYEVEMWDRSETVLSVQRPFGYLFPEQLTSIAEVLRFHGIEIERLEEPLEAQVEVYQIAKTEFAEKPFQKHKLVNVDCDVRPQTRRYPAGTYFIRSGQRLGSLAVYLLEPQSEDGLTTWNFFDEFLKVGGDFPMVRLVDPVLGIKAKR